MNTLLVSYLLDNPEADYPKISAQIKKYPDWAKIFQRVWMVKTSKSCRRVRTELSDSIEGKGKIIVINITDSAWASYCLDDDINEWMKDNV